jgi:hypothetical protein
VAQTLSKAPTIKTLQAIPPALRRLPAGTLLWRVYDRGGAHPTTWDGFRTYGPTGSRFDHHPPPPRTHARLAILYASDAGATALVEVFQQTRTISRSRGAPALAAFALARSIDLLDLRGTWPTRAGGSMAIHSGSRARAREWSRAIHAAYPGVEGLLYASSMNAGKPAVALYERAQTALPALASLDLALNDPSLAAPIANVAAAFGYAVTP